jgi:hypothetical protein
VAHHPVGQVDLEVRAGLERRQAGAAGIAQFDRDDIARLGLDVGDFEREPVAFGDGDAVD